jgi:rod shape-determining protein MreC
MRNLFQFFLKYFQFFLFLFLEIVSISWIVKESSFHQSAYINSSNQMVGNISTYYHNAIAYINLKKVNDSLAAENALLKANQDYSFLFAKDSSKIITDSNKRAAYKYIVAKVISNETNKINNYIIIDKGSKNGIKKNMGVICDHGVVGIVKDVSDDFALIISVLHSKSKVGVRVKESNFVSMMWDGYDATTTSIIDLPKHVKIRKNDTVYTSGESWFYPANIMVGTIADYELKNGNNFYQVKVKLSTDFQALEHVYVVNSLLRAQTDTLTSRLHDE